MAYATQKTIVFYSPFLVILRWFFKLCICGYFAWIMYYRQSYQVPHQGNGFVSIKTKGAAYHGSAQNITIWDGIDTTYPAQEKSAVFVTASYLSTPNQTRGTCDSFTRCNSTSDCTKNLLTKVAVQTGECVNQRCQVFAWCPLESEQHATVQLKKMEKIRVAMKSFANFQGTGVKRHDKKDMKIEAIIQNAGVSLESVKVNGSVIAVNINWNCNFDVGGGDCKPEWSFTRLDDVDSSSSGYNFRYVKPFRLGDGEVLRRDLLKVYGLRIIILSHVQWRKFDIIAFVINAASVLGMLALANYFTDMVAMWLMPNSPNWRNFKFMNVDAQETDAKRRQWSGVLTSEDLNKALF